MIWSVDFRGSHIGKLVRGYYQLRRRDLVDGLCWDRRLCSWSTGWQGRALVRLKIGLDAGRTVSWALAESPGVPA
ncbi:unnamed protein product [Prunus armeniaca]|uniref:Uncharacterized protein n=1 Tax=Prunus armeniaca TaxID=36596 RepID=A0A6J5VC01_PRUAR|nr:unnamed protein product [Prunus armeniaca]